jgi:hypothetical protein
MMRAAALATSIKTARLEPWTWTWTLDLDLDLDLGFGLGFRLQLEKSFFQIQPFHMFR